MIMPTEKIHPDCPNFKWYEVWKSETALRKGIDNTTDDLVVLSNVRELVINILQPLRNKVGPLKPQSWVRVEELEKDICWNSYLLWCGRNHMPSASSWSAYFARKSHPQGCAVDIESSTMSNKELYDFIDEMFDDYDQLILEFHDPDVPNSGWVHVSWAGASNRHEKFTIG